jgi:polysaccharide pyruvyl transferase WcaK-like protein
MIHHVFANRSNVGDWLSARGIQSLLAPCEITEHLCDQPFVEETLAALSAAGRHDFIVIGGGGLFMDYFEPFWEGFSEIATRVPFCIWGVGYCDIKRENSRPTQKLIEQIVLRSRLCVVRDELTRKYLSHCKIRPPVACPSVTTVEAQPQQYGLLHVDAYDNVGPQIYEEMNLIGRKVAAQTGRRFRKINNIIAAGRELALQNTLNLFAQADLVLTGRLHGCIIALAMGRKVLAVSGDHKIESFMQAAGLGEWVIDKRNIGSLFDHLQALPSQRTPREFIEAAKRGNYAIAKSVCALVRGSGRSAREI